MSLAQTGVYGNPYALPTGPTAHVSPGYTVLLAAIFHFLGTGVPAEMVKELVACLVSAIGCAAVPFAAEALGLCRSAGWYAGLVSALVPIKPLVQIDGDWEAPYTALFLTLLTIAIGWQWRKHDVTLRSAWKRGLLWGLALLFSSVLLPMLPVVLLGGLFVIPRRDLVRYLTASAVELTIACLCLLPWVVRNELRLGAPVATRTNLGLELRVSNNDQATPDQRVNYDLGVYDRYHPLQNKGEALKVQKLGEVAYNRQALEETKQWIGSHRQRFLQLTWGRFVDFWFYPDPSRLKALVGDITAVLGLLGWLWLVKANRLSGLLVGILLVCYSAPSYLIHVGARQRYPIDWLLTLLSVYCALQVVELIGRSRSAPQH